MYVVAVVFSSNVCRNSVGKTDHSTSTDQLEENTTFYSPVIDGNKQLDR